MSAPAVWCLVTGVGDDNVWRFGGGDMARRNVSFHGEVLGRTVMPAVEASKAVEAHEAALDLVDVWLWAAV